MTTISKRSVFLAHSSGDKALVREIHKLLLLDGYAPWLAEENLIPGQDWEREIEDAVQRSNAIVVFLSSNAIDNAGYIHKELRLALEVAERQPESSIHIIPIRLDTCELPKTLRHLQWLDFAWHVWTRPASKDISIFEHSDVFAEFSIGDRFSQLQRALLVGAGKDDPLSYSYIRYDGFDFWYDAVSNPTSQTLEFLVRGQHPNGERYHGVAKLIVNKDKGAASLRTRIANEEQEYEGVWWMTGFEFSGVHQVKYWGSGKSKLLVGAWGDGGLEELIPTSELLQRTFDPPKI